MPLAGTSHCVSENRILAGLVQICSWSDRNCRASPLIPGGRAAGVSPSGFSTIFFFEILSFRSVSVPFCLALPSDFSSDCCCADQHSDAVNVRLDAAKLITSTVVLIRINNTPRHGWIYATANARDE